jgi:hypothetical protein
MPQGELAVRLLFQLGNEEGAEDDQPEGRPPELGDLGRLRGDVHVSAASKVILSYSRTLAYPARYFTETC